MKTIKETIFDGMAIFNYAKNPPWKLLSSEVSYRYCVYYDRLFGETEIKILDKTFMKARKRSGRSRLDYLTLGSKSS